jgi:hypothetical protein
MRIAILAFRALSTEFASIKARLFLSGIMVDAAPNARGVTPGNLSLS